METEVIKLLQNLVSINSININLPGGIGEKEMVRYLVDYCEQYGIRYERQPVADGFENLLCFVDGESPEIGLLFESHMDTVAIEGMTIEPFSPEIRDGFLYGRGSCDTKATLAGMLTALTSIHQSKMKPGKTICLAAVIDEEYLSQGVLNLVAKGIQADAAVVGEPTELRIIRAHKGVLRWQLKTRGIASHSAKPELGRNAITDMAEIILALNRHAGEKYPPRKHPLIGPPTMNIGTIRGGVQVNFVPDSCQIEIDRRLLPGEERNTVLKEIEAVINEIRRKIPHIEVVIEAPYQYSPAMETPEAAPVVQLAIQACEKILGHSKIDSVPFGTDAAKLTQAGIPSIVFGPGSIDQAHTVKEWVDVNEVARAAQIFHELMLTQCS